MTDSALRAKLLAIADDHRRISRADLDSARALLALGLERQAALRARTALHFLHCFALELIVVASMARSP